MLRNNRLKDMSAGSLTVIGLALALGFLVAMLSSLVSAAAFIFPDLGLEAAIHETTPADPS